MLICDKCRSVIREMEKNFLIVMSLVVVLFGCGKEEIHRDVLVEEQVDPQELAEEQMDLAFPERVPLEYSPIEFVEWNQEIETENWLKHQTYPFGNIKGEDLFLDVYSDNDDVHGILYNGQTEYKILFMGFRPDDMEVNLVGYTFGTEQSKVEILGTIWSGLNIYYVLYDYTTESYSLFSGWGKPFMVDLNQDGVLEIIEQVEGHHNHPPDVGIIKWEKEGFVKTTLGSSILNELQLDSSRQRLMVEYTFTNAEMKIHATVIGNEEYPMAVYKYDNDQLVLEE